MKFKYLVLLTFMLCTGLASAQKKYTANWASIDSRPTPKWYTDAKFGIFIHWGVYSVPAWAPLGKEYDVYSKYAEWYWKRMMDDTTNVGRAFRKYHVDTYGPHFKYQDFAGQFKAELFKPEQWADVFAASGAKYVVLTSKHHEGFALWPNQQAWNWNSVDIGPHRDLAGDLTTAVKAKGLKMGFYYSMYEWYNPLYHVNVSKYVDEHMLPQFKDLVIRYKPDVVWPDGEWEHPSSTWKSTEFLAWLFNDSPVKDVVAINDRWGKETRGRHGGYYTTEYDLVGDENAKNKKIAHAWEECRAIGGSFGLNRTETLADYSTADELVHILVEKVAKGGNLLLDIGPAADGTIPVIMQERLLEMGTWLKQNGDAIYGTTEWTGAPDMSKEGIYFTRKGTDIYVIITGKLPTTDVKIQNLKRPSSVTLLQTEVSIKTSYANGSLTISPTAYTPGLGKHAWVYKVSGAL